MALRDIARSTLLAGGLLPSRYLWRNPFKIVEYDALTSGLNIRSTDAILDVGCGGGPQDLLLARRAQRVVGIDVSASEIARARGLAALYARARRLEYPMYFHRERRFQKRRVRQGCQLLGLRAYREP